MSEARKCDRCHGFYDIAEEQQDKQAPYEFKGDYINLHLWVTRNGIRKDVKSQWYDLCPKCMTELECWLKNNEFPIICEPDNEAACADRSNEATEKELELASKLNDAKIYIAQLKSELGYTMTKEEIDAFKEWQEDLSTWDTTSYEDMMELFVCFQSTDEIYLTPEQYNRFILLYCSDQLNRWGTNPEDVLELIDKAIYKGEDEKVKLEWC